MKIGILTYHSAHNYGAVLQCYALKTYLETLGHEVIVIDYRPKYIQYGLFVLTNWFSLNPKKTFSKISFQLKILKKNLLRNSNFKHFISRYLSPVKVNLEYNELNLSYIIIGSDQIWRKNNKQFDDIYWGNFKASHDIKLISYAASTGNIHWTEDDIRYIHKSLCRFKSVSVREISIKKALETSCPDISVDLCIDPTFLLPKEEWLKILPNHNLVNKPYLLIYEVIHSEYTNKIAHEIANKLGLIVVEISSKVYELDSINRIETAAPEDFLKLINNASFIVTTSFHGTAFSLIFKKCFITIKQNIPSDIRMQSILESAGETFRFVEFNNFKWDASFLLPPKSLDSFINASKSYLTSNIR